MKKYFSIAVAMLFLAPSLFAQKEYLTTINPATGAYSTVDSISGVQWIAAQSSAYDQTDHHLIFNGVDNTSTSLLYDVGSNGALVTNPPVAILDPSDNLAELRYDNASHTLYGLNWVNAQGKEFFVSINTTSGAYTDIAPLTGVQWITGGASAMDAAHGHFIFIGQDANHASSLYTVDVTNGSVVSSPSLSTDASNTIELRFDDSSNTFFGLYMPSGGAAEHFVSIDASTGAMTDIAALTGVQWVNTGTAAFNEISRQYIFVGQDASYQTHLYSVNALTGAITYSPTLADSVANVTALQYDNTASNKLYALLWGSGTATGVNEPPLPEMYRINGYPNPTSSQATLTLPRAYGNITVTITNTLGAVMRTDEFENASDVTIKRGDLPAGAYVLSVMADKAPLGVMKLVVIE